MLMQQFLGIDEQLDVVQMYLYNPFIQSLQILESNQLCNWYCYPSAKAVRDIAIAAVCPSVRPSHFLVYAITWVDMDGFE
jgi:hypothetical protein